MTYSMAKLSLGMSAYNRDLRKDNKLFFTNGLKKHNFPHAKREGISSIMDSGIKRGDYRKTKEGLGDGAVSMVFIDEDGNQIVGDEASMTIGDINFSADANGRFRLVDEGWINHEAKIEEERREYVDSLTKKMVTDNIFRKTLGLSKDEFDSLMKSGGGEVGLDLREDIASADSHPSVLASYVPSSQLYLASLAKQRAIIRYFMPIIQKSNETKSGELGAKDAFSNETNDETLGGGSRRGSKATEE